jgi:hypothetical protein
LEVFRRLFLSSKLLSYTLTNSRQARALERHKTYLLPVSCALASAKAVFVIRDDRHAHPLLPVSLAVISFPPLRQPTGGKSDCRGFIRAPTPAMPRDADSSLGIGPRGPSDGSLFASRRSASRWWGTGESSASISIAIATVSVVLLVAVRYAQSLSRLAARESDGAPFLRLAGSQVGVGGGDESRLATVPPDSVRRQLTSAQASCSSTLRIPCRSILYINVLRLISR